jgi:hypothetical protein
MPETNQLTLSGTVSSRVAYDGYLKGVSHAHSEWMHFAGHRNLTGTVSLVPSNIGTKFSLGSKLEYRFSDVIVDENEIKGFSVVTEAFAKFGKELQINAQTPGEALGQLQGDLLNNLKQALERAFSRLAVELSQHAFIPPGGGVFTFQNARYTQNGDLLFDIIYQAP